MAQSASPVRHVHGNHRQAAARDYDAQPSRAEPMDPHRPQDAALVFPDQQRRLGVLEPVLPKLGVVPHEGVLPNRPDRFTVPWLELSKTQRHARILLVFSPADAANEKSARNVEKNGIQTPG
ncbi:MAG: hypothetical protein KatS3mg015_2173 [Fimbriimonadales bacterium]|nr:MAG: hypothetical protein KatS3mg015_2173 [Fimbriimonadales bacterium]